MAQHQHLHHTRSASVSVPDIRRPHVQKRSQLDEKRQQQRSSSGPGVQDSLQAPAPYGQAGTSPHTAKETFLNYFFGGPGGPGGPNGPSGPNLGAGPSHQVASAPGSADGRHERNANKRSQPPSAFANRDLLPDLGSGRRTRSGAGLDSGTTAFDMKSLGKHIEAVSYSAIFGCLAKPRLGP